MNDSEYEITDFTYHLNIVLAKELERHHKEISEACGINKMLKNINSIKRDLAELRGEVDKLPRKLIII